MPRTSENRSFWLSRLRDEPKSFKRSVNCAGCARGPAASRFMNRAVKHRGRWLSTACIGTAWVACVAIGIAKLTRYQMTPGPSALAATIHSQQLNLAKDRPTLIMFVHSRCPCSSASIEELARLMTICRDHVAARVLFVNPADQSPQWSRTDLWDSAAAIPTVELQIDQDGAIAQRLNVQTSGHVLLFDPSGKLLFSGGITESRGHVGDNAGLWALIALIHNPSAAENLAAENLPVKSSVFGCQLMLSSGVMAK
jgi:hypothetical protein